MLSANLIELMLGRCATCGLGERDCPGHIGHIELAVPVYNPMMFKQLVRILRAKCFECHQLRLSRDKVRTCLNLFIYLFLYLFQFSTIHTFVLSYLPLRPITL
jgi:DNA-directed RNA polymerase beta' subunit